MVLSKVGAKLAFGAVTRRSKPLYHIPRIIATMSEEEAAAHSGLYTASFSIYRRFLIGYLALNHPNRVP